jgi:hypothetical protein
LYGSLREIRCEAFRLAIESAQHLMLWPAVLMGQELQDLDPDGGRALRQDQSIPLLAKIDAERQALASDRSTDAPALGRGFRSAAVRPD